ncbi:tRNA synthetases class I (C) catalytic domain-containing protein [Delphinella strobiligena]|nr:tRNA synthetases class I (C) catalytic domain-containing protein [Delphinella strobiligena]
MAAAMPEWTPPPVPAEGVKSKLPPLSIYNSLTRGKTPFVPLDPTGDKVTWYACGPTVYDDAHLGHARNYVSTDIIRRIITDYFHFHLEFVMNITDVDDKIILAARQQHLLRQFIQDHKTLDTKVLDETKLAFQQYVQNNLSQLPENIEPTAFANEADKEYGHVLKGQALAKDGSAPGDKEAKIKMHLKTAASAAEALSDVNAEIDTFYAKASGVLLPYIDSQLGHTIDSKDHSIFTTLTKNYEDRFFHDMRSLNVRAPDTITRVTEYGQQIVDFVKQIQDNGFAYDHDGSVYYDTQAWEASGGVYARLEPWNRNDKDLLADGEGSLSKDVKGSFKRSPADFALWKASKPGEPAWDSPWGPGRPGWHIECSAMASNVLGQQFDIHSGGIDLAFPHHDNELAQSEAYWSKSGKESKQWVNYFLHMGHLSIQGSKMSKSLKNFTTIREALAKGKWTSRGLRIAFLLGAWKDGLEITEEVIKAGSAWEERVNNFFIKARDLERNPSKSEANGTDPLGPDGPVKEALQSAKFRLHDALCDSFDTPTSMRVISDLITAYNSEKAVSDSVTFELAKWITEIVNVFGLDSEPDAKHIGWSGIDVPAAAEPYIYPLAAIRDEVRKQAIAGTIDQSSITSKISSSSLSTPLESAESKPYVEACISWLDKLNALLAVNAEPKKYLPLCDELRDSTLWDLGIYLEDRDNQPSLVRPLNASLRQERANKEGLAKLKLEKAEAAKAAKEKEEAEKLAKGKLNHLEMFRTSEFSAWDEEGLPTKDAEGKDIAKSRSKKLKKDWERQKKLHEAWLASQA